MPATDEPPPARLEDVAARAREAEREEGTAVAIASDAAAGQLAAEMLRRHGRVRLSWRDQKDGTEHSIVVRS